MPRFFTPRDGVGLADSGCGNFTPTKRVGLVGAGRKFFTHPCGNGSGRCFLLAAERLCGKSRQTSVRGPRTSCAGLHDLGQAIYAGSHPEARVTRSEARRGAFAP